MMNLIKKIISAVSVFFILFICINVFAVEPNIAKIYVSTHGNDSAKGTEDSPFLTFERAAKEACKISKRDKCSVEVLFDGGIYRFDKTAVLNADYSAADNCTITFKALEGENPVFTGAIELENNFKPVGDGIYKMKIPTGIKSRMLLIDGQKRNLARFPNEYIWAPYSNAGNSTPHYAILLDKSLYNVLDEGKCDMYLHTINSMKTSGGAITEIIKKDNGKIMGVTEQTYTVLEKTYNTSPSHYYIENSLSLLDNPGEFYIDSENGELYYMPTADEDISTLKVEYANLPKIIDLNGTLDEPVSGICFEGISFTGTADNNLMYRGYKDIASNVSDDYLMTADKDANIIMDAISAQQKTMYYAGALNGSYVENTSVKDCKFYNTLECGINLLEGNRNIQIVGNTFEHIGASSIHIAREQYVTRTTDVFNENIDILNNVIWRSGDKYSTGAIFINISKNLNISNNDIEDSSYSGIGTNAVWYTDYQLWKVGNYTINNNKIKDALSSVYMNDGGPIYNAGPLIGKNVMTGNYCIGGAVASGGSYGIYFDGNNRGWTKVENNVIENCYRRPLYVQLVSTQISTNEIMRNNYVSPIPYYMWGNFGGSLEFREDKNTVSKLNIFASSNDFPQEAKNIMKNAGLADEYKKLYDEVKKPFNAHAPKALEIYRFKEDIEGYIPVQVENNTDKEASVTFEVCFGMSNERNFKYTATVPANVQNYILNIPYTFKDVETVEVGELIIVAMFENGDTFRVGIDSSYGYVAEDVDCFMIDIESEGYSESGVWSPMSYFYDIYGRKIRMGKNVGYCSCTYTPEFLPSGKYRIIVGGNYNSYNDEKAKFTVNCGDESHEVIINQKGSYRPAEWELGVFEFTEGEDNYIKCERSDYSREAVNSAIGAYVIFERIDNETADEAYILEQYKQLQNREKEPVITPEVLELDTQRDMDVFSETTRVDPLTLKNGRVVQKLTNRYSVVFYSEPLQEGEYEVLYYRNKGNGYCNKMNILLVTENETITTQTDLTVGNEGWTSLGKHKFSDDRDAQMFFWVEAGSKGIGIVDSVKFVKVK